MLKEKSQMQKSTNGMIQFIQGRQRVELIYVLEVRRVAVLGVGEVSGRHQERPFWAAGNGSIF